MGGAGGNSSPPPYMKSCCNIPTSSVVTALGIGIIKLEQAAALCLLSCALLKRRRHHCIHQSAFSISDVDLGLVLRSMESSFCTF